MCMTFVKKLHREMCMRENNHSNILNFILTNKGQDYKDYGQTGMQGNDEHVMLLTCQDCHHKQQ